MSVALAEPNRRLKEAEVALRNFLLKLSWGGLKVIEVAL
jgi:hypothetical protein